MTAANLICMSVYQICYVSKATHPFDSAEIQSLIKAANQHNFKNDISGVLLYRGGMFLQLIEGEKSKAEALFQRIEKDTRHTNLIRVFDVENTERIFSYWAMGYHEVSDFDVNMVKEILSWNRLITDAHNIDKHLALHMLKSFERILIKNTPKDQNSK